MELNGRRRSRVNPLVATVVLALLTTIALPVAGAGAVVAPAGPDGSVVLDGHGYGHGRGMSQHGARGAATLGLSSSQILDFYYPGTVRTGQPNTDIRVGLSTARAGELVVDHTGVMSLVWRDGVLPLPSAPGGAAALSWRLRPLGADLQLDYVDASAGVWRPYSFVPGQQAHFASSAGSLRLVTPSFARTEYRGLLRGVITPNGFTTVNLVLMEDYLRSVVPAEMPSSWPAQALQTQAVAARTYASRLRHRATGVVDTCDTTACQVYKGIATYAVGGTRTGTVETASTDAAIRATAGQVVITGGPASYALTEFSASNGGWTTSGGVAYLPAKQDPYDGVVASSANTWTTTVTASAVQKAWPSTGAFRSLEVLQRDGSGEWGGRTTSVRVQGSAGAVTVTGATFRTALGLRSTWWQPRTLAPPRQVSGSLLADMDGDGTADLVARSRTTGEAFVYRGTRGGAPAAPTSLGTGWAMHDQLVSPGDVTGDGRADLYGREAATGVLWLYAGDGRGGISSRRSVGTGWGMHDLIAAPGDVTGDGRADLYGREAVTGVLWLYAGDGQGGSSSRRAVGTGWGMHDAVLGAGDVDGDGRRDLLARAAATGDLWLYTGDGTGAFTGGRVIDRGWQSFDALVGGGDVDGDGGLDLVVRRPDGAEDGLLRIYPLSVPGQVLPGRDVGTGWDMHDTLV